MFAGQKEILERRCLAKYDIREIQLLDTSEYLDMLRQAGKIVENQSVRGGIAFLDCLIDRAKSEVCTAAESL